MDAETYPDTKVVSTLSARLIAVRIDGPKNPGLRRKYHVRAYPSLAFVDGEGNLSYLALGFRGPEQLLEELERPAEEDRKFGEIEAAAKGSPEDPSRLFDYAVALARRARTQEALAAFVRVAQLDPQDKSGKADDIALFLVVTAIDDESWAKAEELCRGFLERFDGSDLSPRAHLLLGWAQQQQGRLDDAIATWGRGIELFPDSTEAASMKQQIDAARRQKADPERK